MKSAEWWEQDQLVWLCDVQQLIKMAGSGGEAGSPGEGDEATQSSESNGEGEGESGDNQEQESDSRTDTGGSGQSERTAQTATTEQPSKPDWRERRIAKLTAQLNEEKAKNAAATTTSQTTTSQTQQQPDFQESVQREAARLAAESEFNRQCAEVGQAGEQAFGAQEFGQRVAQLAGIVDRSDPGEVENYKTFIRAAIATGEAPKLIHMLGADPNEAARVMSLPPAQMGVELAKLSLVQPDGQSRAPRPAQVPRGSGGGNAPHTAISASDPERADRLTTAEWMKRRNEEAAQAARR